MQLTERSPSLEQNLVGDPGAARLERGAGTDLAVGFAESVVPDRLHREADGPIELGHAPDADRRH